MSREQRAQEILERRMHEWAIVEAYRNNQTFCYVVRDWNRRKKNDVCSQDQGHQDGQV